MGLCAVWQCEWALKLGLFLCFCFAVSPFLFWVFSMGCDERIYQLCYLCYEMINDALFYYFRSLCYSRIKKS